MNGDGDRVSDMMKMNTGFGRAGLPGRGEAPRPDGMSLLMVMET